MDKSRQTVRWYRNPAVVWPALIVGFVLLTQWPMIKGMGYRALGFSPAADTIPWRTDFAAALEESRQSGKPVLLRFTASWCPPCQAMKHDVWPDDEVEKVVTDSFIPVYLDTDEPASSDPARRYEVSSIPRILVVDADGRVIKDGAYMDRKQMVRFLGAAL